MKLAGAGICTRAAAGTHGLARWRSLADGALAALGGRRDVPILVASCNGAADELDAASWSRAFSELGELGELPVASGACASGLQALWLARGWLAEHAEVIVLAVDIVSPASHANFTALRVLDDQPAPWQPTSTGFRAGEAAVALRLQRGTGVVGPLLGHDNLAELVRAIGTADVAFAIGQGTGPAAVDAHELAALPPNVPLSTALVACGHTIGASGLLSLALAHLVQTATRETATREDAAVDGRIPDNATSISWAPRTDSRTWSSSGPDLGRSCAVRAGTRSDLNAYAPSDSDDDARGMRDGDRARALLALPFATAVDGRPLGVPREVRGDALVVCRALGGACAVVRITADAAASPPGITADAAAVAAASPAGITADAAAVAAASPPRITADATGAASPPRILSDAGAVAAASPPRITADATGAASPLRILSDAGAVAAASPPRITADATGAVSPLRILRDAGAGSPGDIVSPPPASRWVEPQPPPPLRLSVLRRIAALPRPAALPGALVVRLDAPLVPPDEARIGGRLLPSVVLEITPGFVAQLLARTWGFAGPAVALVGGSDAGWVPTLAAIERIAGPALVLHVRARDFEWGT